MRSGATLLMKQGLNGRTRASSSSRARSVSEGRLCVKYLLWLLWHYLWRSLDAQSMRDRTIPGRMRLHTNALNSADSTMDLTPVAMMHREAGARISTGTGIFGIRRLTIVAPASTGMGFARAMSAHFAAIGTVIAIGAE